MDSILQIIANILILFSLYVSEAQATNEFITQQYPGGKILTQTECSLGASKVNYIGMIVQKKEADSNGHPLVAVIAKKDNGKWKFFELPKKVEYKMGMANDFLSEYWVDKTKFESNYKIKCTVPNKDDDITTKANGQFTREFDTKDSTSKHLCFPISAQYNSWTCYGVLSKDLKHSFVQMNAD